MWEDRSYFWVVLCKNNWFHRRVNLFYKHRIPLAETDPYEPPPALEERFAVKCDECHKQYLYKPSEVFKIDQDLAVSFTPHPLFAMNEMTPAVEMTGQYAVAPASIPERRRSERLPLDVGLVVRGVSPENAWFQEGTITISVSAHGALMLLSSKVTLGQTLFVKNSVTQKEMEGRVTRLDSDRDGMAQVGIEFAHPSLTFWPVVPASSGWNSLGELAHAAS